MDGGKFMLGALNFCLIHFLKLKYNFTFTHNAQNVNSNAHLYLRKGIFGNKHGIIAEMENTKFA